MHFDLLEADGSHFYWIRAASIVWFGPPIGPDTTLPFIKKVLKLVQGFWRKGTMRIRSLLGRFRTAVIIQFPFPGRFHAYARRAGHNSIVGLVQFQHRDR